MGNDPLSKEAVTGIFKLSLFITEIHLLDDLTKISMLRLGSGQENQRLLDAECGRYTKTSVHGLCTLMKEN